MPPARFRAGGHQATDNPLLKKAGQVVDAAAEVFQNLADLGGRPRGLRRQILDLARNDGKALAGIAGTGSLDGRVQSQEVGLLGDRIDLFGDLPDLGDFRLKAGDFVVLRIVVVSSFECPHDHRPRDSPPKRPRQEP